MAIYLIVLMCTLSHSGFGGSRVAVSLYALDQGASQVTIGVLMALYAVVPLFMAVHVGRLADRVGPRVPMLIGTAGVVIGLLLPPLIPGLPTLFVSALILGSTFHFFFITVQGIAGGIGGAENRANNFALVGMGFSAAGTRESRMSPLRTRPIWRRLRRLKDSANDRISANRTGTDPKPTR